MEFFLIGYIIIPLGIAYFIYDPRRLYELTIFSIPFTGTSLFQISEGIFKIEGGIRASMVLGTLCLIRHLMSIVYLGKISINKKLRIMLSLLFTLGLVSLFSLIMPFLINGKILVLDAYSDLLMYAKPKPLHLKFQYITQVAYFIFGCLLAYYFSIKNDTKEKLKRSILIYLYSTCFVCLWGILEFVLFYINISYPSFLFNQNSVNVLGTKVLNDLPRITSVSLEPSIMSQQLLTALPLLFWPLKERVKYFSKIGMKVILVLIILVLLLSTSSTAYVGLMIFVSVIGVHYLFKKKIRSSSFILLIAVGLIGIMILPFLAQGLIYKLTTFSGEERLKAIKFGWYYFTQYPIFGIGWGVFPSWDFIVCLLTGIGIIGFLVFFTLLACIRLFFQKKKNHGAYDTFSKSIFHSLILLIVISQFSGFIYHSQFFWLILGLAIASCSLPISEIEKNLFYTGKGSELFSL